MSASARRGEWSKAGALCAVIASALALPGCGGDEACSGPSCEGAAGSAGMAGGAGSAAGSGGGGAGGAGGGGAGGSAGTAPVNPGEVELPVADGACVPTGPTLVALGSARTVLYDGPRELGDTAVRRQRVFVLDATAGILRMPENGSEFETVVAGPIDAFLAGDLNLYWAQGASIRRAALSATDAEPVELTAAAATGTAPAIILRAHDETELYATAGTPRTILQLPIAGGETQTLASGVSVADMKLDAGTLYYADAAGQVYRLSMGGDGEPEAMLDAANANATAIATDGVTLYWADGITLFAAPVDDAADDPTPIGASGAGVRAGTHGLIERLLLSGGRLYWSDASGNVGWTTTDGSECALIVAGVADLRGWDVEEGVLYVTSGGGAATAASTLWSVAAP